MNFLMDIVRASDHSYKFVTKISRNDNRKRFILLINECRARGISLRIMPKAMARHTQNSSLFDKAGKLLLWHIEWKLMTNTEPITCNTSENSENLTIGELLNKALEDFRKIPAFVLQFTEEDISQIRVFWLLTKKKSQNSIKDIYKELNISKTLKEILPELSNINPIIEYPCLYISTDKTTPYIQIIK